MSNFLDEIFHHKQAEIAAAKQKLPLAALQERLCELENSFKNSSGQNQSNQQNRNFFAALKTKTSQNQTALICEIKRGSPSAGLIRTDFNAAKIAEIYEKAGAACLSVLTDEKYFLGGNQFLTAARKASNLPILRKDFFVDCYQIFEAKLLGANCILLIVAMLPDEKLQELENIAFELGLSVLVEVHDEAELLRATKLKSKLIGINNRNLKTLKTDLKTSLRLADFLGSDQNYSNYSDYLLVAESGIKSSQEIKLLKEARINSFLIGEYLMRQENIEAAVRELLS